MHTPEYAFEHVPANVAAGAKRLGITYPVALDNDYKTWNAFHNESWPADYLIDATGRGPVRRRRRGRVPGDRVADPPVADQRATPASALPTATDVPDLTPTSPYQTPETYLGAARAQYYDGSPRCEPGTATFTPPAKLAEDSFSLGGTWAVTDESITARRTP